jgi:hypothetical protein
VFYTLELLDEWLAASSFTSTSEYDLKPKPEKTKGDDPKVEQPKPPKK